MGFKHFYPRQHDDQVSTGSSIMTMVTVAARLITRLRHILHGLLDGKGHEVDHQT